MNKHPVTVWPSGKVVEVSENESLYTQLKEAGFGIKSKCGGCASCGDCILVIKSGDENLNEPSFEEKQLLGNVFHLTKERLSCQTKVSGAITVDISMHADAPAKKAKAVRRSREEADKVLEDRRAEGVEKRKNKVHKLGGGKKPKAFSFHDEEEK